MKCQEVKQQWQHWPAVPQIHNLKTVGSHKPQALKVVHSPVRTHAGLPLQKPHQANSLTSYYSAHKANKALESPTSMCPFRDCCTQS